MTCSANKKDGSPCTLPSNGPDGFCWVHSPANAPARRRGQSRGGKAKTTRELVQVKDEIRTVIADVRSGAVERGVGAVAFQGYNVLLKALEAQRKQTELDEVLTRIEALEAKQSEARTRNGSGRRGLTRW
jgi:hypothetical protein